jgi:hypothetical protein
LVLLDLQVWRMELMVATEATRSLVCSVQMEVVVEVQAVRVQMMDDLVVRVVAPDDQLVLLQ